MDASSFLMGYGTGVNASNGEQSQVVVQPLKILTLSDYMDGLQYTGLFFIVVFLFVVLFKFAKKRMSGRLKDLLGLSLVCGFIFFFVFSLFMMSIQMGG